MTSRALTPTRYRHVHTLAVALAMLLAVAGIATAAPGRGAVKPARGNTVAHERAKAANAAANKPKPASKSGRIGLRATLRAAKENFQVYRGDRIEGWANKIKVGRSEFNPKHTVQKNLTELVKTKGMNHYYAKIDGRDVLHVVVELGQGKTTKNSVRDLLRRVGSETIELNYKGATQKNPYGHVAVRVGNGALYDLTGTQGVATLPKFMERTLTLIRGKKDLTFARKRNMRKFMEGRKDSPNASASVYYGMLFAANSAEVKQTQTLYNERLKQATSFNVNGGNGSKGEYSCAQFLTEKVPFFNSRGVGASVGAKSTTNAAKSSLHLEAVVVYKMPSMPTEQAQQYP
tara:strand:- start:6670 stop:7707 length:1038 start_codon:yes stop_codon:yes gene_type:complete